jgi:ABC-type branched-subunit amino acid transport system substrate-binding protein
MIGYASWGLIDVLKYGMVQNVMGNLYRFLNKIDGLKGLYVTLLVALGWGLFSCAAPGSTKPVIKIGLAAPFEGEQRSHGYQRLYGVKLALQEVNLSGGVAGYKIELVALNDYADTAETILQAQELVIDSDIMAVIGQWDAELFAVSEPVYTAAQLAVVKPTQFNDPSSLPTHFAADYESLSGSPPDLQAQQAYLATYQVVQAIENAVLHSGSLGREQILRALLDLEDIADSGDLRNR